jgi:opacity protein-like surface antigen
LSKRPAGALAGMAMILLLASPASAADWRDTVIETPSVGSASISASADASRYPIDDGNGETVAISVTEACQASCSAANPQQIADTLGTFVHGFEMELLTVQLDTPSQIEFDCGYGAQACYYGSENKIVLNGNDGPSPDGANREYVLAHEYGHHVARHRESPPPFPAAIDWGTPRWSS